MVLKTKITRIVSVAAAALCLTSGLNFVPLQIDIDAADTLTAFEITEEMQLGWNIGNSLDSYNAELSNIGLSAETCWGNPKTTQEMINAVKAKGFNTIRVPVTWFQHVDENYTIDAEWLARVKEVVDYCYNNDMYVILNLHHEEPYQNRSTLGADYEEITKYVTTLWGQLAETFKDYDQRLIFETMNEPRATGTDHEWWGPTQAEIDTINKINADALKVIRDTKSPYSDTRLVMMPGYCASSDMSMMSKVVIPDDDYVAASVHAYSPYSFAMDAKVTDHSSFTEANKTELINIMDGIRKTFSDKDIPVVLGEFSSSNFDNTDARVEWAETYIATTKAYGIPCVLWDNNVKSNGGGEAHGYLNRSDCTWYEPSEPVVDAMFKVLNDDSIKWGSERKSPVIKHEDITKGKQLIDKVYELDASVEGGNCTEGRNVTWADIKDGEIAVEFTGDAPVIAVCDGAWDGWTEIKPYDVDEEKGIAYYSSKHIAAAWGEDKVDSIEHIFARTNSTTTVKAMAAIGAAQGEIVDPPVDNTKIYPIDLSSRKDGNNLLILTFEGKAGSVINGCLGYMNGADWEAIEWEGKIDSNGKFITNIVLDKIPEDITKAEAQMWWCDDENAEMTGYELTWLIVEPTDAPTNPVENVVYGDANCDGNVTIADATAILQHLGNEDKYGLSEQGRKNADVDGNNGITTEDALTIQMIDAKLLTVKDLPLKAS